MQDIKFTFFLKLVLLFANLLILSSCSSMLPQSGPSAYSIKSSVEIPVIQLSLDRLYTIKKLRKKVISKNLEAFKSMPYSPVIGVGDTLEISIYESPPVTFLANFINTPGINYVTFPPQRVDNNGFITVPFVGKIYALGKTPKQLEEEIKEYLKNKLNNPYVMVRVLNFSSSKVTILGHVHKSGQINLDYNTLTLLDALAKAGGVTSPINKTLIRISRNDKTITIPLEKILKHSEYNIYLKPGDTITVIYKTKTATFLGAVGQNQELEFEAKGISLAQALGRIGGLKDDAANIKGIFLFRLEDKDVLSNILHDNKGVYNKKKYLITGDKVPVIYTIDLSKPSSFFLLKELELKDGDIVYVSTAPAVQLNKFLSIVRDIIQPIFMIDIISNR